MSDNFRFDISKIPLQPLLNNSVMNDMRKQERNFQRNMAEKAAEENAYKEKKIALTEEQNELLRDIKTSLKGIDDIVLLLSRSVNQQEETLDLLRDVFLIGTSPDEETAHSRYQKVKSKIKEVVEDYETANTLIGLAKSVYITAIGLV